MLPSKAQCQPPAPTAPGTRRYLYGSLLADRNGFLNRSVSDARRIDHAGVPRGPVARVLGPTGGFPGSVQGRGFFEALRIGAGRRRRVRLFVVASGLAASSVIFRHAPPAASTGADTRQQRREPSPAAVSRSFGREGAVEGKNPTPCSQSGALSP